MTDSAMRLRNGWTSFALGLMIGTTSVLLGHCLLYFLIAAAFNNFVFEPLFSTTLFSGLLFVVLACVVYARNFSSRKKQGLWLGISTGKTLGWTIVAVLAFSLVFGIIFVSTELGGFGMPTFWFSIFHVVPAMLIAFVLTPIGIVKHRKALQSMTASSQPA